MKISIDTIDKIKDFSAIAQKYPFDIDVIHGRYVVDAKSIMGLFSLDCSHSLQVQIHSDSAAATDFISDIEKYIV